MTEDRKKSNRWFIAVWAIVLLLFIAYTAYWFIARGLISQGVDDWVAAEKDRGAVVEYSQKKIGGFPFRFALQLDNPVYQTAEQPNLRWEGEKLQLVMQPWKWNHIIARTPGRNVVDDGNGFRHTAYLGKGSAGSVSWTDDSLNRIGLTFDDAEFQILGEDVKATDFSLSARPLKGNPNDLDAAIQWDALTLPNDVPEISFLGNDVQASRAIVQIEGFFPAFAAAQGDFAQLPATLVAQGAEIKRGEFLLNWGPLKFLAIANLTAESGAWNGTLKFRIEDHEPLATAMTAAGYPEEVQTYVGMIGVASQDDKFLELSVRDNDIFFLTQKIGKIPTRAR